MTVRPLAAVWAAVLVAMIAAGCSDGSPSAEPATTSSTVAPGCRADQAVDPELPNDINPIPYRLTDNVALGNWALRIAKVKDPWTLEPAPTGLRYVAIDVEVENGALKPQRLEPDVFLLYDERGCGSRPVRVKARPPLGRPVASAATAQAELVFELAADRIPSALVFAGTQTYGPRVLNGLIALDPDYQPKATGD